MNGQRTAKSKLTRAQSGRGKSQMQSRSRGARKQKREDDEEEIRELEERARQLVSEEVDAKGKGKQVKALVRFDQLPLSKRTALGGSP